MGEKRERNAEHISSSPQELHSSSVALAATAATVITKSLLHPLDTIKCRLQSSNKRSPRFVFREYAGKWGPRYLYSGLPLKLVFYMPYQAIYMTTYNGVRNSLKPADVSEDTRLMFATRTLVSAAAAELSSCVMRVPMETAKMRLQATVVPNTQAAVGQICRHGLLASVRLVKAQTLLHDIPYSVIQWFFYESLRPLTQRIQTKSIPETAEAEAGSGFRKYVGEFVRVFFAGGFSGLMASTITVPLDTIRTRVVVAAASNPSITVRAVVRETYRFGGLSFFFRGGCTRVLWVTTNMAVYFPVYEMLKKKLLSIQEHPVHN